MKKIIFIFAASFGCILLVPGLSAQEETNAPGVVNQDDLGNVTDEFQESFFEALKQKGIENYGKAITALENCRKLQPNNAVVYFELGKNYSALEDYELAAQNLQKAKELAPDRIEIPVELYHTYMAAKDYPAAISEVKSLIKRDDSYSEDLANLYLLSSEYDKALEMLDELDRKNGRSSYRDAMRRQIYAKTNNTEGQVGNLEEAIAKDPENEQNYLNLIYIYSENGQDEEAFQVAQQSLEANPGSTLVHLALYKFYLERGNPEEAINSMKTVFGSEEIDPESKYKVLNDFLMFVNEHPDYEDDLLEVSKMLSEEEQIPKLYQQLGEYYLKKGRKEDALNYFELGLGQNPDNFDLLKSTISLQIEFAKFEKAKTMSDEGIEIFPAQPVFYLLKGVTLNKLQEYSEAEEILKFGLDYLIDDKQMERDFYSELVISYRGQQQEDKAGEYQQKADALEKELN